MLLGVTLLRRPVWVYANSFGFKNIRYHCISMLRGRSQQMYAIKSFPPHRTSLYTCSNVCRLSSFRRNPGSVYSSLITRVLVDLQKAKVNFETGKKSAECRRFAVESSAVTKSGDIKNCMNICPKHSPLDFRLAESSVFRTVAIHQNLTSWLLASLSRSPSFSPVCYRTFSEKSIKRLSSEQRRNSTTYNNNRIDKGQVGNDAITSSNRSRNGLSSLHRQHLPAFFCLPAFKMLCLYMCLRRNKVAPWSQRVELPDILASGGSRTFPAPTVDAGGDKMIDDQTLAQAGDEGSAALASSSVQMTAAITDSAVGSQQEASTCVITDSSVALRPCASGEDGCKEKADDDEYSEVLFRHEAETNAAVAKMNRTSDEAVKSFAKTAAMHESATSAFLDDDPNVNKRTFGRFDVYTLSSNDVIDRRDVTCVSHRPLVILIPWLKAKRRHVQKYCSLYLGWGMDVLHLRVTPMQIIRPVRVKGMLQELIALLKEKNHFLSDRPIVIHGLSIGAFVWGQLLLELQNDANNTAVGTGALTTINLTDDKLKMHCTGDAKHRSSKLSASAAAAAVIAADTGVDLKSSTDSDGQSAKDVASAGDTPNIYEDVRNNMEQTIAASVSAVKNRQEAVYDAGKQFDARGFDNKAFSDDASSSTVDDGVSGNVYIRGKLGNTWNRTSGIYTDIPEAETRAAGPVHVPLSNDVAPAEVLNLQRSGSGVFAEAQPPLDRVSLEVQLSDSESYKDVPIAKDEGFDEALMSGDEGKTEVLSGQGKKSDQGNDVRSADCNRTSDETALGLRRRGSFSEVQPSGMSTVNEVQALRSPTPSQEVVEWLGQHFSDPVALPPGERKRAESMRSLAASNLNTDTSPNMLRTSSNKNLSEAEKIVGELLHEVEVADGKEGLAFWKVQQLARRSSLDTDTQPPLKNDSLHEAQIAGDVYSEVQKGEKTTDGVRLFGGSEANHPREGETRIEGGMARRGGGDSIETQQMADNVVNDAQDYDTISYEAHNAAKENIAPGMALLSQQQQQTQQQRLQQDDLDASPSVPYRNPAKESELQRRLQCLIMDSPTPVEAMLTGIPSSLSNNPAVQAAARQALASYFRMFPDSVASHYVAGEYAAEDVSFLPTLMLYSRSDTVAPVNKLDQVIKKWRQRGLPVQARCWDDSPHVGHFRRHPEEYTHELFTFLNKFSKTSDGPAPAAKSKL